MFLIYSSAQSSRLSYILDFLVAELLQVPYEVTSDKEGFLKSDKYKISYSSERLGNEFFIQNHQLLFEKGIKNYNIEIGEWEDLVTIFKTNQGDIPFDLFAASFYLLSRYEEYLPYKGDRHGRYRAEDSIGFRAGFLSRPIINLWVEKWKETLKIKFPSAEFPKHNYTFTPTIDIDNAYAYKYKGISRVSSGLVGKLVKLQFKRFFNRLRVHAGLDIDPYDTYEKQERIHSKFRIKPVYFILLGDFGQYDRNLSHNNIQMIKLIKRLSEKAIVGIHPSYASNKNIEKLKVEKSRLEKILNIQVDKSRQHYLKLQLPATYNNLIETGIKEDYTMGYPSMAGFRAGTCTAFMFYDLLKEKQRDLKIIPFAAMDSTMNYYLRFKEKEVIAYLRPIVKDIKKVGGNFSFIFHNESMGGRRNWANWGDTYEKVIKLAVEDISV